MIIEVKPNLSEIIRRAEYKGETCCGHDFWDKSVDYGDVVLCGRCNQYFTKIKHLPWVIKPHSYLHGKTIHPAHTYHLDIDCFVKIPVRLT